MRSNEFVMQNLLIYKNLDIFATQNIPSLITN